MASSVAALQRLSASIDVTAIPASRSNRYANYAQKKVKQKKNQNCTLLTPFLVIFFFSRASAYEDTTRDSDKEETAASAASTIEAVEGRPQYLTANCVVYSFYNGDLTSAIQDHFDRALKRSRLEQTSAGGNESPSHSDSTKLQSGKCRGCVDSSA